MVIIMTSKFLRALICIFLIAGLTGCGTKAPIEPSILSTKEPVILPATVSEQPDAVNPTTSAKTNESSEPTISARPSASIPDGPVSYSKLDLPELKGIGISNAEVVWGHTEPDADTLYIGFVPQSSADGSVYQIWAYNIETETCEKLFSLSKEDINSERFTWVKTKYLQRINSNSLCIKDREGKRFYLFHIESRQMSIIDFPTENTTDAFLSPDGKYILYTSDNISSEIDKETHLYNIESGQITILFKNEIIAGISNNSKYIVTLFRIDPNTIGDPYNGLHVWDSSGNLKFTYAFEGVAFGGSPFSWSDDHYLLFSALSFDKDGNGINTVYLLDITTQNLAEYSSKYEGLLSPNAHYSIYVGDKSQLLDLKTGQITPFQFPDRIIRSKCINNEGDKVAITTKESEGEIGVYILRISM